MKPWLLVISGLLLLFLSGCVQLHDYEEPPRRGVALSEAMKASASGSKESLHGSSVPEPNSTEDSETARLSVSETAADMAMVEYDKKEYRWQVLADTAYLVPLNGEIEGFFRYTLTPLAFECERHFLGLYVGGGSLDFKSGSLPDEAAKNPWMLETGFAYRYHLNGPHVLFSPYLTAGLGAQLFGWDYRQAVIVDGDTIDSDSLSGVTGYAGLGVAVWRRSPVSLFGEAGFGGTIFRSDTGEGFHNDVFNDFGYFSVKAGLAFKF
jgi:hypothetical protein